MTYSDLDLERCAELDALAELEPVDNNWVAVLGDDGGGDYETRPVWYCGTSIDVLEYEVFAESAGDAAIFYVKWLNEHKPPQPSEVLVFVGVGFEEAESSFVVLNNLTTSPFLESIITPEETAKIHESFKRIIDGVGDAE